MAKGLRNVQIIRAGTWRGSAGDSTFTVGDLEDIVRSFVSLGTKTGFRPHLKLGHTDAQKFFGQRSGFPSLGEVTNVWRDGEVVYADIDNVPEALLDLIEKRRYTQLSIEIYPLYEYEGVKYKNVLAAVALLGAELPAVKGLNDLAQALFKEEATLFAEATGKQEFSEMPAVTKTEAELAAEAAEKAALQARVAAAEKAATEATAANAALLARLDATEKAGKSAKIAAFVDAAIAKGTLAPKNRDAAIALGEAVSGDTLKITFGEGDAKAEKIGVEAYGEFLASLGKVIDLKEHGKGTDQERGNTASEGTAAQAIDELANAAVKAGKAKNYAEAFAVVMADPANKALKQRYAEGL